jgi:hypothetical protein
VPEDTLWATASATSSSSSSSSSSFGIGSLTIIRGTSAVSWLRFEPLFFLRQLALERGGNLGNRSTRGDDDDLAAFLGTSDYILIDSPADISADTGRTLQFAAGEGIVEVSARDLYCLLLRRYGLPFTITSKPIDMFSSSTKKPGAGGRRNNKDKRNTPATARLAASLGSALQVARGRRSSSSSPDDGEEEEVVCDWMVYEKTGDWYREPPPMSSSSSSSSSSLFNQRSSNTNDDIGSAAGGYHDDDIFDLIAVSTAPRPALPTTSSSGFSGSTHAVRIAHQLATKLVERRTEATFHPFVVWSWIDSKPVISASTATRGGHRGW